MIGPYKVLGECGAGATGCVLRVLDPVSGKVCALKTVSKAHGSRVIEKERLMNTIVKYGECPFIAKVYDVFEHGETLCIVMEYCVGGSLTEYVSDRSLSLQNSSSVFYEMISGLRYLHKNNRVIHRDLKPDNVLLDRYGHARLTDFGLATYSETDDALTRTACGSPAFAAPEVITGAPYTSKVDIWSAGVILYLMVTGQLPFCSDSIQKCYQAIVMEEPVFPKHLSDDLVDLLKKLLQKDPTKRISISDIFQHPWVRKSQGARIEAAAMKAMEEERENMMKVVASTLGVGCEKVKEDVENNDEVTLRTFRIIRDVAFPALLMRFANEIAGEQQPKLSISHVLSSANRGLVKKTPIIRPVIRCKTRRTMNPGSLLPGQSNSVSRRKL